MRILLEKYLELFQGALVDKNEVFPDVADLKVSEERSFKGAPRIFFAIFPPLEPVEDGLAFSRKSACSTNPKNNITFIQS